jgi:flagellar biosynthesis/type III secretory pathway protein FliH
MPKQNIRLRAEGQGVRGHGHGFERDRVGGNRIPAVGLERRAIGLGHRVTQPEQGIQLDGTRRPKGWKQMLAANKPAKTADLRPGKAAKMAAAAKRKAAEQRELLARQFNNALRSAAAEAQREATAEGRRIATLQQISLQQAFDQMAARLGNAVR